MKLSTRSTIRAVVAGGVVSAVAAGLVLGVPAAAQGTAPPWAPGGVSPDQNAKGGLAFYDAAGTPITSGATNAAPFAAFVQGRVKPRTPTTWTDTKAALFVYVPQVGQTPDLWTTNEQVGLASTFPNAAAPAALAASPLPLATGTAGDTSLDQIVADIPNASSTTGYQNVYELRMYVNAPGHTLSTEYDYADVLINAAAHTWTLVYTPDAPSTSTAPGAPTAIHGTGAAKSATVSWTAPASDGGAAIAGYDVQFSSNSGSTWTSASSAFHTSTLTTQTVTGLTNGVAYLFRVAAINAVGTGAYSTASAAITPRDPSTLTISGPTLENYGTVAAIGGKLTDTTTAAVIASAPVKLWRRPTSTSAWTFTASATSSSTGVVSASITFTANDQWQWRYAGSSTHAAVNSAAFTITVKQPVSIAAKPTSVTHGRYISIYGTVKPSGSGQKVTLQKLVGTTWTTVTTAILKSQKLPSGVTTVGYIFPVKLATVGTFKYRVSKAATSTLAAGTSAVITVKAT